MGPRGGKPWSLFSEIWVLGCTVGPNVAPGLGRSVCAFLLLDVGGGGRVGYFRVVFVAESLLALFAALDEAFPIMPLAKFYIFCDQLCVSKWCVVIDEVTES
jgi:hypothetical protein